MSDPIPAEAVQAASQAIKSVWAGPMTYTSETFAQTVLEAAAPFLAEHIARLLDPDEARSGLGTPRGAWAARIAREAFTAGERSDGTAPKSGPGSPQGDETHLSGVSGPAERSEALTDAHSASGSEEQTGEQP